MWKSFEIHSIYFEIFYHEMSVLSMTCNKKVYFRQDAKKISIAIRPMPTILRNIGLLAMPRCSKMIYIVDF